MKLLELPFKIVFFAAAMTQLAASVDGINHFTHWNWGVCWLLTLFIGWTPVLGTITGVYGATSVWNWHWYYALLLFTWPLILFGTILGSLALFNKIKSKLRKSPF